MPWEPRIWDSPLGRFVHEFGAYKLADRLELHHSAIYHWVNGLTQPSPEAARKVVEIARNVDFVFDDGGYRKRALTLDDVMFSQQKHVEKVRAERKTTSISRRVK